MASPQTGIFALGTASHAYLEFDLLPSADAASVVARVAALREPRTTIGGINLVAGFRPELWATIAPDATPAGVTGFNDALTGADGYTMPATQHDVVIWLTGAAYDVVFDLSRAVTTDLAAGTVLATAELGDVDTALDAAAVASAAPHTAFARAWRARSAPSGTNVS